MFLLGLVRHAGINLPDTGYGEINGQRSTCRDKSGIMNVIRVESSKSILRIKPEELNLRKKD